MSLDVYLRMKGTKLNTPPGSGIFVRENGQTREITREEWDKQFPGLEPIIVKPSDEDEDGEVYTDNITHNLNRMAQEAGIYQHLWRPEEVNVTKAEQLIEPLRAGLALLKSDPARFEQFNPENGWGSYGGLVEFVERYLRACVAYPGAEIVISR